MLGSKKTHIEGMIVSATMGWNDQNQPIKHPLIGGIITPRCWKNGQEMKTRVNFDVLINQTGDSYDIARITVFGSFQAEQSKSFAERIARQLVPGRYVSLTAQESTNKVPMTNNDGTPVVRNGQQASQTYTSYVAIPGDVYIIPRDSLESQKLMAEHWVKVRNAQSNVWDFFWKPPFLLHDMNSGAVQYLPDAERAQYEAAVKVRNQFPLLDGMATYGFCKVNKPAGTQPGLPSNDAYNAWLRDYIAKGFLGSDGLPIIGNAQHGQVANGNNEAAIPGAGTGLPGQEAPGAASAQTGVGASGASDIPGISSGNTGAGHAVAGAGGSTNLF